MRIKVDLIRVSLGALTSYDWKRELSDFLHAYGRMRSGKWDQKASEETLRNRTDHLFSTFTALMKDRKLKTLSQIKPRHMPRIFEMWNAKPLSKLAQRNYFTNVKWFWRVCGIEAGPIADYATEKGEFTINRTATKDKSWKGNGVDFNDIYQQMYALDPVGARLMQAMKQNGLRLKESLRLIPHEADGGDRLLITKGTKTGRPRQLLFDVFEDENFRRVLDHLKDQVLEGCHLGSPRFQCNNWRYANPALARVWYW